MMRKIIILIPVMVLSILGFVHAQPVEDKAQIEKERQDIQKEIQQIQGIYDKVKGQTKLTLNQLNMLNKKINLQERYIGNISKELRVIDDDIYHSNLEIYRLQRQLDTLKIQYARTVVYAYKNRSAYDYLNFIFSAGSFNDAIRRIAYLKSYRTYREKQVNTILETQKLIAQRKQQQLGRKDQKNEALQNESKQKSVLMYSAKKKMRWSLN
jgi:murein hydrolase activator